jgi:hypothetical protein
VAPGALWQWHLLGALHSMANPFTSRRVVFNVDQLMHMTNGPYRLHLLLQR